MNFPQSCFISVIPAKAGIQTEQSMDFKSDVLIDSLRDCVPAFAGITAEEEDAYVV
jgi:hypothetical protein